MPDHSSRRDSGLSADLIRGFYAVLDRDDEALAERLVAPDGAGATVLQVRMKPASTAAILAAARRAREVTRRHGALLIVNDRLDVALAVGADGVHLGQDDLPLAEARALAGHLLIGISTHDLDQVEAAVRGGADYLGYGPVYPTGTKLNPDPVRGIHGLASAIRFSDTRIGVIAIGGITPGRAAEVAAAGAAGACAIGAVNEAADPGAAGREIGRAWRG